jgi:hypothetical protein
MRHFFDQGSRAPVDCQAISLPPPADFVSRARRVSAVDCSRRYDTVAAFVSNGFPLWSTAHAMRASLAASATTTVFT